MGNTTSDNKQQYPPPYEEINNKPQTVEILTIEEPITADTIIRKRKEFKDKQIEAYETQFKSTHNEFIKSINKCLKAAQPNKKIAIELLLVGTDNKIDDKYKDDNLTKLYMVKRINFIKEMYPGFKITIIEQNSYQTRFLITLKE